MEKWAIPGIVALLLWAGSALAEEFNPGDINKDGMVDMLDQSLLCKNWLSNVPVPFDASLDMLCRPRRVVVGHRRLITVADNFVHTDWTAVAAFATLAANDNLDNVMFSETGTRVTGVSPSADNYTCWLWRAMNVPGTAMSYRLVYRVLSQGQMEAQTGDSGLQFFLTQDNPPKPGATVGAKWNFSPVTPGYHDIIWNSGSFAISGVFGGYNQANPSTGVILRARSYNAVNDARIVFDRFEAWPEDTSKAWLLLGFDDQHVNQIPAVQYCLSKGIPVYIAVNPCNVGAPGYMTWEQLRRFHRTGMVQMCQHLDAYPSKGTLSQKRAYMRRSRQLLEEQGLTDGVDVYVIPSGTDTWAGMRLQQEDIMLMREYVTIIRGTQPNWSGVGSDVHVRQVGTSSQTWLQPKTTPHSWWRSSLNVSDVVYDKVAIYLGYAKAHGALMALHCHMFEMSQPQDITLENFKAMIDSIAALGDDVEYKTFNDL